MNQNYQRNPEGIQGANPVWTDKARNLISWAGSLFQRVSDLAGYLHHNSGDIVRGGRGKGPGTQTCLHFTSCCCHCSLVSLSKLCSVMGTNYSRGALEGM